ncbi:MAG: UDP-N-acetylmuramoyl-L-alanine--D-glutamate ligase [Candidatus Omnitrophica bacterium]|nr:UDP-N-acetylmuramoyl-L-alanine--D-glutamate ligase [Candidatus Omnitrophota bacterium]
MNIENFKKVCVVGWGKSGISLCNVLLALKKEVLLTESKPRTSFHPALIDKFAQFGVKFEFGAHTEDFIKQAQLLVLSPGVDPVSSPAVMAARTLNIPSVGEVEFSFWLTKARFIAITGTNGKTTTTFLTYRVLKTKRKRVFLGGNIGIPVSSFILQTKPGDLVVLEISSFQLETIMEFAPHVACLLNLEPNHLDRHPTFKDYYEAKMNIFRNQKANDWAVLNGTGTLRGDIEKRIKSNIIHFSNEFPNENFSCIYRTATIFGLSKADCLSVFAQFRGLPHRLQSVREVGGVHFINDSKSTNPSSTMWALKSIKGNVILIAGGKDKGVDYQTLAPYLKRVKKINLIGQAAAKIKDSLGTHAPVEIFPSLEDAVAASFKDASKGDTVVFSPMCSSFDMFSNYMDRGRKFMAVVNKL